MTVPGNVPIPDFSEVIPTKYKPFAGLVGTALTFVVPYFLTDIANLPSPWPLVVGFILFILTGLGIYRVPFAPKDAVLVKKTEVAAAQAIVAEAVNSGPILPPAPAPTADSFPGIFADQPPSERKYRKPDWNA